MGVSSHGAEGPALLTRAGGCAGSQPGGCCRAPAPQGWARAEDAAGQTGQGPGRAEHGELEVGRPSGFGGAKKGARERCSST